MRLGLPAEVALSAGVGGTGRPVAPRADDLTAPSPGTLVRWLVEDGAEVSTGEGVVVLEAMKTETTVTSPGDGRLHVGVEAGTGVVAGQPIGRIE